MKIGVTGEEVMRRWKNLRDHFVREFKRPRKSLQEAKDHHMYLDGLILSV